MFNCKRCGKCCGIVPFSKAEYKKVKPIADKMGVSFAKMELVGKTVYLSKKLLKKTGQMTLENLDLSGLVCPFLQRDVSGKCTCSIYDLRPEVCRLYGEHTEHPYLRCPHNIGIAGNG